MICRATRIRDASRGADRRSVDSRKRCGEASRFEALLTEYQKAPQVTRTRLHIEALEEVYGNSNKVLLDAEGSGNLLYLPIDQLVGGSSRRTSRGDASRSADLDTLEAGANPNSDPARDRRTRQ